MGVVLDSSVLIAGGECPPNPPKNAVETWRSGCRSLSCDHRGIYRAKTDADPARRQAFSEELRHDMVVHSVTVEIAELAGRIEGEQAARGVSITFEDLLTGAAALHIGYDVATINVRHFQAIPGLSVVQF